MQVEARLRAFAAVARQRSFSRAAEELYVTQPAVSKHVASLEAELGQQLVVRDRRALSLTPAGEVLADYVLRAEALLANARRALASGADAETGTLSLAASDVPGTYLLPSLPRISTRAIRRSSSTSRSRRPPRRWSSCARTASSSPYWAGSTPRPSSRASRWSRTRSSSLGRCASRPTPAGQGTRGGDVDLARRGTRDPRRAEAARWQVGLGGVRSLELPSWEAVKLACASGAGIAAISRFALDEAAENGRLAILDVPRWRLARTVSLVTARDVPLTPTAERFRGLLREAFRPRAEAPPNSNLPAPATPLIGREDEMTEVIDALRGEAGRLVTLTGAGGSGKTRLAIEAAATLVDEVADGVYFVALARLREPDLVPGAIAGVLGLPDADDLDERLRERELLLVLDNLELVDAAGAIAGLLAAAPRLRILATSRVALRIAGEREVRVEPLALDAAVTLFEQRAQAVRPGFVADEALATVCERLDRLPLALGSPLPACGPCRPPSWQMGSLAGCRSSSAGAATPTSASGRCERRSRGATTCSALPSVRRSHASRSSPAAATTTRRTRSVTSTLRRCTPSPTTASWWSRPTGAFACSSSSASWPRRSWRPAATRRCCAAFTPSISSRSPTRLGRSRAGPRRRPGSIG